VLDDPKALACDAYSSCFKNDLPLFDLAIDKIVAAAAKSLNKSMVYVLLGETSCRHRLTSHSKIHQQAIRTTEKDYFPQAMMEIYDEAFSKKAAGKGGWLPRLAMFEHINNSC
jgi:hypothetical protein